MPTRTCLSNTLSTLIAFLFCFLAGCGSNSPSGSIQIAANSSTLVVGGTMQLHATDTDFMHMVSDATASATWSSSNSSVLSVNSSGLVTGIAPGSATIKAVLTRDSGTINLTVPITPSLALSPKNATVAIGGSQQYSATATSSAGTLTNVTASTSWSVLPINVATITPSGMLTAVAPGLFTVTGVSGGLTGTVTGSVSTTSLQIIAITPATFNLAGGNTQQLQAFGTYSDGTSHDVTMNVAWSTSDATLLTVDASGLATATNNSTATAAVTITAKLNGVAATASVQVTPGATITNLVIRPTSSSIALGSAERHTATALYSDGTQKDVTNSVIWSSANANTSSVDATGMNIALTPGMTTLQASLAKPAAHLRANSVAEAANPHASAASVQASSVVIVTPATVTSLSARASRDLFPVGSSQPVQLTGTFSDGSTQDLSLTANWQSSDTTVSTINQSGVATGLKAGKVIFSASFGGLTASTIGFQVLPSSLISTTIAVNSAAQLAGLAQHLQVIGTYSDGTTHDLTAFATFVSADPSIFAVDSTGLGYGVSTGSTQITAEAGGFSAITEVYAYADPVQSLEIFPHQPSFALGTHFQFAAQMKSVDPATGVFLQDVTDPAVWFSSDPSVLTIDAGGLAKSGKAGTTTVYATVLGVTQYSDRVTVTDARLQKLVLSQASAALAANTGQQYSVTGYFSDGSVQDLTNDVLWDTSDNTVASISATGLCIGMKAGQVQVTATLMGQTASVPLAITNATLVSTAITPGNAKLPINFYYPYSLIGTFSDGTTEDLSYGAIFLSPTPSIVSFYGQQIAGSIAPGIGQLSAQYGYFMASTPVTVTDALITGITFTPASATVRQGSSQQMVITGNFNDGTSLGLNGLVSLYSSSPLVAPATRSGLLYGTSLGTSTLTATIYGVTATANITVLSNVLSSIMLTPANPVVSAGTPQQLTATGVYDDGSTGDVTSTVTWTSSNPSLLTVSATGVATASGSSGTATVTATSGTTTASFLVSTQPANVASGPGSGPGNGPGSGPGNGTHGTPSSVVIAPTSARLAATTSKQLTALATYADGSTADISSSVTWSSSSPATATIGSTGLLAAVHPGTTSIQARLGTLQTSSTIIVSSATLQSVAISPSGAIFAAGSAQQLTLTGTFSDGTTQDLTSSATWSSSNAAVASISASGLASGIAPGSVQFTASYGDQTTTSPVSTVTNSTLVSVAVTPSNPSFAKGTTQQFSVTGTYSDGSTRDLTSSATFTSSDPSVILLSTTGVATGMGVGSARVTVSVGGQTTSTQSVTVTSAMLSSVSISPRDHSFANGTTQQFRATGTFSDGTTQDLTHQAVWSSSNPQIMTIDQNGVASGGSVGSAQITSTVGGITVTTDAIELTSATLVGISLTPTTAQIARGTTQQFTATGAYTDGTHQNLSSTVIWTTSNGQVVSIDANGLASGNGVGSAILTASYMGRTVMTGSFAVTPATLVSLSFSPSNPTVAMGTDAQVTVFGVYSDGTMQDLTSTASFSSSNTAVASIGSGGAIDGGTPGSATITVSAGGQTSSFPVTVSTATLTSLAITPAHPAAFAKGTSQQFTATGTFSDGTTQNVSSSVAWLSSNTAVFTIDSNGLATGSSIGSASLSASFQGQTATTSAVQVTAATVATIAVNPQTLTLAAGASQQFTATATYTDSTTQNLSSTVMWSSTNTAALNVNASGLANAGNVSTSTNVMLTATYGGSTGSSNVTVTSTGSSPSSAAPTQVIVMPTSTHLAAGTTTQLTAIGTYPDGSTRDISSSVTWTSANTSTATVSVTGLVSAVAPGTVAVQAQVQGQSGVLTSGSTVVVSTATLQSLAISPSGASFAAGSNQQFTLTGTYSDGTTQNLSSSATWGTSNAGVATISATGLASGVGVGSVQFTAMYGGQTITSTVDTVTAATLVSISVTPSSPSFAKGTTQQFTVTGTYSDGSTRDLTSSAAFTSSDTTVVSISSAGLATGVGSGNAQITVSVGGQTSTTQSVTVTPATLVSIHLAPQNANFADGSTQQFSATGSFSDGTTQDLTHQAVWSSSNPQVVTINQNGLATGGSTGSAQIIAALNGVTASTNSVQVTPATLMSLTISPTSAQIAKGTTQQLTARGTYTDGSSQDLTSTVTWTSSNGQVASINGSGLATGNGVGSAQLTASYLGQTASTSSFNVTPATLVSISFNPANPTVAAGTSTQIMVIGTYSDGSTQDLTSSSTLSSSNSQVAVVGPSAGGIQGVSPGTSIITVAAGGQTSSFTVTVSSATLTSLAIMPATPSSFAKGTMQQFTATGTYSDGSTQNLSSTVSWLSSNTSVFTINANGLATGVGVGSATLTATSGGQSATTPTVQVTPATVASIAISPQNTSLSVGTTQQYTATATYTDSTMADVTSSAVWASANPSVATITANGLASAVASGSAAITAQLAGMSGSSTLTVVSSQPVPTLQQIVVTPTSPSVQAGGTQQFTATGMYSDQSTANLTTAVTWSSSVSSVATINASGLASAVLAGSTSIQAQLNTVSGSASFIVTAPTVTLQAIHIAPGSASVAKGNTQQFTAQGVYTDGSTQNLTTQVTWQSSVPSVASINNSGLATSLTGGNTQIWASFSGQSAVATLTVSPATLASIAVTPQIASVASGTTQQYKATGTLTDGSTQDLTNSVAWTSTNNTLATVSSTGLASTAGTGSVIITATATGSSISGSANLMITATVATSLQVTPSPLSLPAGKTQQLLVTSSFSDGSSQNVTSAASYATTNPSVISVDSGGNLHAVGPGTATVTIMLNGVTTTLTVTVGNAVVTSIAITPQNLTLAVGQSQQLTATATYTDGSTQDLTNSVTWASSAPPEATVSATGNVIVAQSGSATISATYNSISATDTVTGTAAVITAIAVSPSNSTLAAGQGKQFAATATMSDGTQQPVTTSAHWSVSDPTKATVSNSAGSNGLLTSTAAGMLNVMASLNGTSGSAPVTVTAATLSSLTINPSSLSLPAGTTQQLSVTGAYSDGSSADVTTAVSWSSTQASIAYVDQAALLHAVSSGTATLSAQLNGVTGSASAIIGNATLSSITITPANPALALGQTVTLTATGHYSDNSTANITHQVQWSSSNPAVATISATGVVTTLAAGSSTLTATLNGQTQSTTLTVSAAILQSISVQAGAGSFALGQSLQLKATGVYSDNSTQDLTHSVTWSSSAASVGVVSSTGLATGATTGAFNAKATFNGISGTLPLTVTNAVLVSIDVTPKNDIIVNLSATRVQYTAVGTFSDGTTLNLTHSVHWTTSGLSVGDISSTGSFSPLGVGTGTVKATSGTISGQTGFTVVAAPI